MNDETITIDVDKLRKDLINESYGAFFGGGFGGALIESFDIERMSDEELVKTALQKDIDICSYSVQFKEGGLFKLICGAQLKKLTPLK